MAATVMRDMVTFVPICINIPPSKPFPLNYVYLDEQGNRVEVQVTINVKKNA